MAHGWLAGMDLTGTRLYRHHARYERQSGTQSMPNNTATPVSFPTAVATDSLVTPSSNYFTLSGGLWLVVYGLRVATASDTWDTYVERGSTTASVTANILDSDICSGNSAGGWSLVDIPSGTTDTVLVSAYQNTGGAVNITSFGHLTHIAFARLNP